MIKKKDKIFLAGHKGLVGSSILRLLKKKGYKKIITISKKNLNLLNQIKVSNFLKKHKPKIVIIAAAKVGGIKANYQFGADFIRENLQIQTNLIHGCHINNINNIIFLGSSCVYPKNIKRKILETDLLSNYLESTNEPYAVAKIAGIKMCESYNNQYNRNYLSLMPTNTFGPGDNYDLQNSHFIPALLKKIHEASLKKKKIIKLWGTGKAKREVIFVDQLAEAIIFFMNKKTKHSLINIGTKTEMTIKQYADLIIKILNLKIKVKFDMNKKFDGVLRKKLNTKLAESYGWYSNNNFKEEILITYKKLINI